MDVDQFSLLDLAPSLDDDGRYRFAVTPPVTTPFHFLYGGAGIAACAEVSERRTGRPLQWITTQFLGSPAPGDVVDLDVEVVVEARMTSQTQIVGRVDGASMFTSLAAHNARDMSEVALVGSSMPSVPPPDDCEVFDEPFPDAENSFFAVMDRRVAAGSVTGSAEGLPLQTSDGTSGGALALWCRLDGNDIGSAATQAFIADLGPLAVCVRYDLPLGGTSLDNTLRVVDTRPTEWALLELGVDAHSRSAGHTTTRMWSQDGRLLGIAQQSALIRNSHHSRSG